MKTEPVGGPGQKKRADPHKWEKREALLVIPQWSHARSVSEELPPIARVLRRVEINACQVCPFWCEERPEHLHDLPPCKFPVEEAAVVETASAPK